MLHRPLRSSLRRGDKMSEIIRLNRVIDDEIPQRGDIRLNKEGKQEVFNGSEWVEITSATTYECSCGGCSCSS
jgi:hypothetical protein